MIYQVSVSLSSDGSIVAIGAPNNDENGSNTGQVRIYYLCDISYSNFSETTCDTYISPSGNYIWDTTGIYKDTNLSSINNSILKSNHSSHYSSPQKM